MKDSTISAIIRAAAMEPPELQARFIAEQTIAAVRLADAAISDQALEAEFRAWWSAQGWHEDLAALHVVLTHIGWTRHLLSGARHASPPSVNPGPCPEFQRPTMDEVMNLANMFGLKVNNCYALMWLVVTSIAAWGDNGSPEGRLACLEAKVAELQEQLHKIAAPAQPVASGHPPEGPAMPTASMPIEELGLPARAYNGLKRARINTVGDLLHYAPADLLEIKQFGTTSLDDVVSALDRLGLELWGTNS